MSKLNVLVVVAVLIASTTGCGMFRSVEQWKCDRLGMCYFGTRPSAPQQLPVYQPVYPQPAYAAPMQVQQPSCCGGQPGMMPQ